MSMSKSVSNSLILLFACIGCFVALILFYEHLKPNADVGCKAVGGNCAAVNESDYGHVGKVPTSIFGLGMYVSLVAICLKRRKLMADQPLDADDIAEPEPVDDVDNADLATEPIPTRVIDPPDQQFSPHRKILRSLDLAVWLMAAPAVGISWWLQSISIYQLISFCPWCMGSAFLVTFIFLLASRDLFLNGKPLAGEQKLLVGTVTFIAALSFLMALPDIMAHIRNAQGKAAAEVVGPVVEPPTAPPIKTADMEVTGPADAPFTIVEFADYQCPHCAKTSIMLSEELKKHPNRFRFAFRNYPLQMHHWASQAALAAEAAGEQGKFWQMHDFLFAHQADMAKPDFSQSNFTKYAASLGLNTQQFEQDAASDKIISKVANDSTTAQQIKVQMTPTFFIINRKGGLYQITGMTPMKVALEDTDDKAWK